MEEDPLEPIEKAMRAVDDYAFRCRDGIDPEDARSEAFMALLRLLDDERERWVEICKSFAADNNPPHKGHEETYCDGWLDACNEIMWAGEKA